MDCRMQKQLHETRMIPGPAGQIETLLWFPPEEDGGTPPPLSAVVCHPHPLFGGTMHNKVVYQAAKTIHKFGLPVARLNFRGVGRSEGAHDNGHGEVGDALAVIEFLAGKYPGVPMLVAGFSFGSWVGSRAGCRDPRVKELICLGLPVAGQDPREFSYLGECEKPKLFVTGEFDRFGPPSELRGVVETFPPAVRRETEVQIISGVDHFFAGRLDELDRTISEWLLERHSNLSVQSD
jgi:alpha/beta superfamily hydrolase